MLKPSPSVSVCRRGISTLVKVVICVVFFLVAGVVPRRRQAMLAEMGIFEYLRFVEILGFMFYRMVVTVTFT